MGLTSRISVKGNVPPGPEDFLSDSLGVVFPDDVTSQHGDAKDSLVYASPHLPSPLYLELAEPVGDVERKLFSHHLWNSSLLLAELVERDTLDLEVDKTTTWRNGVSFDVGGKSVMELGAGTGLTSIMAGLLGAQRIVVTDYPAPAIIKTLAENVARNTQPKLSPPGIQTTPATSISVHGHLWGDLSSPDPLRESNRHTFDRIIAADCLWMSWEHENLQRSIDHFLKHSPDARCWVVAGFHTGRKKMREFFAEETLAKVQLEVGRIWERDCDGQEREWSWDRDEDVRARKRWLVVSELKRTEKNTTQP